MKKLLLVALAIVIAVTLGFSFVACKKQEAPQTEVTGEQAAPPAAQPGYGAPAEGQPAEGKAEEGKPEAGGYAPPGYGQPKAGGYGAPAEQGK